MEARQRVGEYPVEQVIRDAVYQLEKPVSDSEKNRPLQVNYRDNILANSPARRFHNLNETLDRPVLPQRLKNSPHHGRSRWQRAVNSFKENSSVLVPLCAAIALVIIMREDSGKKR